MYDVLLRLGIHKLYFPSIKYFTQAGGKLNEKKHLEIAKFCKMNNLKFLYCIKLLSILLGVLYKVIIILKFCFINLGFYKDSLTGRKRNKITLFVKKKFINNLFF